MKRLNPKTSKPFKRGDEREDGMIFLRYKPNVKGDGYFAEQWMSKSSSSNAAKSANLLASKKRINAFRGEHLKKRTNPKTGLIFKIGDMDNRNRYFVGYNNYSFDNEFFNEQWASPQRWHKMHVSQAVQSAKKRAEKQGVVFKLSTEEALSIFPSDGICPALGIEMQWGKMKSRYNSPSLDRIKPEKGYVLNNVCWISVRANIIKSDASAEEILKVGNFLKEKGL